MTVTAAPAHDVGPATGRPSWLPAAGLFGLVVVAIVVALVSATRPPWLPTSDQALLSIRSQDALSHPPLTGPYSRFGFDHPGPLFLYLQLPFIRLFGAGGALVASAFVAAASVVACGWMAWRRGGFWLSVLLSTALLLFVRSMGSTVVDSWNPWVALLPFLACVVAAWSVWCDDWWALPVLVGFGTLSSQTHISYAPFVWLLFGAAIGWVIVTAVRRRPVTLPRGLLIGSGALLVVLWLPPLVNQVHSADPNGTAILRHFAGDDPPSVDGYFTGPEKPGAGQVAQTVALEMGAPAPWFSGSEVTDAFTGEVVTGSVLRLLPTAAVFAVAMVVGWRRRMADPLKLQLLVLALSVVGVVELSRVTGGVFAYLIRWFWVFGALAWVSALWTLACWYLDRRGEPGRRARLIAAVVPLAVFVWAVATVHDATPPNAGPSGAAAALVDQVASAISPTAPVLVVAGGPTSGDVRSGLVVELDRLGYDVVVPDDEARRFGEAHAAGDRPVATRLDVVAGTDVAGAKPPDGSRPVARYDPLSPAQRATYETLRPRVVAEYTQVMNGQPATDPLTADERQQFQALDGLGPPAVVYLVSS